MGQMVTDFFLTDSQSHRKIMSTIFIFQKEDYHLLPLSLPGKLVFPFHGIARCLFGMVHHDGNRNTEALSSSPERLLRSDAAGVL